MTAVKRVRLEVVRGLECAACGKPAEGNAAVHRDGFGVGPEVDLCDACGLGELPSLETIWLMIANRRAQRERGRS